MSEHPPTASRSHWYHAARRFRAHKAASGGVVVIALITLYALFGPWLSPHSFDTVAFDQAALDPTFRNSHWFGTDMLGRDLFVRTAYGARISLMIGIVTTVVALAIGVIYGAVAGFMGGMIDNAMMRIVDILYALPLVFFVIILVTVFGRNIALIFIAIGAVEWLTMSRIVRAQTISLRQKEFVEAARAMAVPRTKIILRHILPNAIGPVIVFVTLLVPANILVESFLSFLGLGVQEPMTSWGVLIKEGANVVELHPWNLIVPATFLALTMFSFNFIGDGLRDALDPKER